MNRITRRRSLLYVPAISEKMIKKTEELHPDGIIFDLEDAVLPEKKNEARETLSSYLPKLNTTGKEIILRVNSPDTEWFEDDIKILSDKIDSVLIPKIERGEDIKKVETFIRKIKKENRIEKEINIMVMAEKPAFFIYLSEILNSSEKLTAFLFGPADFSKEMRCENTNETLGALKMILIAGARTKRIDVIDGPYFHIKDTEGLKQDCIQAKKYGFDGKQALHPLQIPVINEIFSPSPEEIEKARRIVEKFEEVSKEGRGVAVLDGEMIERLHYENALRILKLIE